MFRLVLIGLLSIFISAQAEARTIRYEFDVIASGFGFQGLHQFPYNPSDPNPSGPPADTTIGPEEYAAFVAAHHPLAPLIGQTGSVAFDLQLESGIFDCVAGFLCSSIHRNFASPFPGAFDPDRGFNLIDGASWWNFFAQPSGTQSPFLSFGSDSLIYEIIEWNGGVYYLGGDATAWFSLTNMEIAPVPVPAGAPLLAAGVLALGIGARRRRRPS